jgi:hypothetical protein
LDALAVAVGGSWGLRRRNRPKRWRLDWEQPSRHHPRSRTSHNTASHHWIPSCTPPFIEVPSYFVMFVENYFIGV